jgi:predicted aspartyl protease
MSVFWVSVVAANVADQQRATPPIQAVVDTGSELTWLPADLLQPAGIKPVRSLTFQTAPGQKVSRQIGYAILRAEGFETIDEVVFADAGDAKLLGVRTLEGFSVTIDNIAHKFIARATIVAGFELK